MVVVEEETSPADVTTCFEFGGRGWSLYRTSRYLMESFCIKELHVHVSCRRNCREKPLREGDVKWKKNLELDRELKSGKRIRELRGKLSNI